MGNPQPVETRQSHRARRQRLMSGRHRLLPSGRYLKKRLPQAPGPVPDADKHATATSAWAQPGPRRLRATTTAHGANPNPSSTTGSGKHRTFGRDQRTPAQDLRSRARPGRRGGVPEWVIPRTRIPTGRPLRVAVQDLDIGVDSLRRNPEEQDPGAAGRRLVGVLLPHHRHQSRERTRWPMSSRRRAGITR